MKRLTSLFLIILFVFGLVSCKDSDNDKQPGTPDTPTFTPVVYEENGAKFINMGKYPQTVVDDENIISALATISTTNELGYFEYNGEEYTRITASIFSLSYIFNNGNSIIDGNVYYFKVEPIKWRVLKVDGNTYTLISERLLEQIQYYHTSDGNRIVNGDTVYPHNYKYSNIRAWLNGYDGSTYSVENYKNKGFYDIAFNEAEKQFIQTTFVDNDIFSTGDSDNDYLCDDTNDKIYILSYKDATDTTLGFSSSSDRSETREALSTDYTRSKYTYASTNSNYYQNGYWWLRSPSNYTWDEARYVRYDGYLMNFTTVSDMILCVRPSMKIVIE